MKGVYRHYKGNYYRVFGEARHSETEEVFVLYCPLGTLGDVQASAQCQDTLQNTFEDTVDNANSRNYWVRPKEMFFEEVVVDNQRVPRFAFIDDQLDEIKS